MRARNLVIIRFSFCPLGLLFGVAGPERAKNPAGKTPPPVSDPFSDAEFEKISPARQANSPQAEVADSSSTNAASFSSACTMKRFPSRCASTIQIVRPQEFTAETQPQLHPALLRFSAMISQYFTSDFSGVLCDTALRQLITLAARYVLWNVRR